MQNNNYNLAKEYIIQKLPAPPTVGLILGTGLGGLAEKIENTVVIPYKDIPGFAVSTAPDHKGQLVCGTLGGKQVVCMQGRLHFYEGHSMKDIIFPIRVMKLLGIEALIITNAAGGINFDFNVGDFMLIDDHINFMGTAPTIGKNDDEFGPRFFDMTYTYAPALKELAFEASAELGIPLQRGVYLGCTGPHFETPAEIRAFRVLGADAVGMSTVPEVIAAAQCEIPVLAISMITNMAAGMLSQKIDGSDVTETAEKKADSLQQLIHSIIKKI